MASALPVAFRTLFTCLFIFIFGFVRKINSSSSSSSSRQAHGYHLASLGASPFFYLYQIILLGDNRGTCLSVCERFAQSRCPKWNLRVIDDRNYSTRTTTTMDRILFLHTYTVRNRDGAWCALGAVGCLRGISGCQKSSRGARWYQKVASIVSQGALSVGNKKLS